MFITVEEVAFATRLVGVVGGPGSDEDLGVADASFDVELVPIEFVAETLKVYCVSVVSPSLENVVVEYPVL